MIWDIQRMDDMKKWLHTLRFRELPRKNVQKTSASFRDLHPVNFFEFYVHFLHIILTGVFWRYSWGTIWRVPAFSLWYCSQVYSNKTFWYLNGGFRFPEPYSRLFWGRIFLYISRIHTAYIGEDSSILGTWNAWWFMTGKFWNQFLIPKIVNEIEWFHVGYM